MNTRLLTAATALLLLAAPLSAIPAQAADPAAPAVPALNVNSADSYWGLPNALGGDSTGTPMVYPMSLFADGYVKDDSTAKYLPGLHKTGTHVLRDGRPDIGAIDVSKNATGRFVVTAPVTAHNAVVGVVPAGAVEKLVVSVAVADPAGGPDLYTSSTWRAVKSRVDTTSASFTLPADVSKVLTRVKAKDRERLIRVEATHLIDADGMIVQGRRTVDHVKSSAFDVPSSRAAAQAEGGTLTIVNNDQVAASANPATPFLAPNLVANPVSCMNNNGNQGSNLNAFSINGMTPMQTVESYVQANASPFRPPSNQAPLWDQTLTALTEDVAEEVVKHALEIPLTAAGVAFSVMEAIGGFALKNCDTTAGFFTVNATDAYGNATNQAYALNSFYNDGTGQGSGIGGMADIATAYDATQVPATGWIYPDYNNNKQATYIQSTFLENGYGPGPIGYPCVGSGYVGAQTCGGTGGDSGLSLNLTPGIAGPSDTGQAATAQIGTGGSGPTVNGVPTTVDPTAYPVIEMNVNWGLVSDSFGGSWIDLPYQQPLGNGKANSDYWQAWVTLNTTGPGGNAYPSPVAGGPEVPTQGVLANGTTAPIPLPGEMSFGEGYASQNDYIQVPSTATLTADFSATTWTNYPTSFGYQWFACYEWSECDTYPNIEANAVPLAPESATGNTITPSMVTNTAAVFAVYAAENSTGVGATHSVPVKVVPVTQPVLMRGNGAPATSVGIGFDVGVQVTGSLAGNNPSYSYQWVTCTDAQCTQPTAIPDATASTYTPTWNKTTGSSVPAGQYLAVDVTASTAWYVATGRSMALPVSASAAATSTPFLYVEGVSTPLTQVTTGTVISVTAPPWNQALSDEDMGWFSCQDALCSTGRTAVSSRTAVTPVGNTTSSFSFTVTAAQRGLYVGAVFAGTAGSGPGEVTSNMVPYPSVPYIVSAPVITTSNVTTIQSSTGEWGGIGPSGTYSYRWYTCSTSDCDQAAGEVLNVGEGSSFVTTDATGLNTYVYAKVIATNRFGSASAFTATYLVPSSLGVVQGGIAYESATNRVVNTVVVSGGSSGNTTQWWSCPTTGACSISPGMAGWTLVDTYAGASTPSAETTVGLGFTPPASPVDMDYAAVSTWSSPFGDVTSTSAVVTVHAAG